MRSLNPAIIAADRGLPLEAHRVVRCLEAMLSFDRYLIVEVGAIAELLDMRSQAVSRALRILIDRKIICRGERVGRANTYRFSARSAERPPNDFKVSIRATQEADFETLVLAGQFEFNYGREDLRRDIAGNRCWIALADGSVVGQLAIRKDASIEMSYLLARVLVDRHFRRGGIGRRLMAAMEQSLEGNRIHAYCSLSDGEFLRFLVSSGFALSGYVKGLKEIETRLFFAKVAQAAQDG